MPLDLHLCVILIYIIIHLHTILIHNNKVSNLDAVLYTRRGKSRVRDQLRLYSEKLGIEFELGSLFPSQNLFLFDLIHEEK